MSEPSLNELARDAVEGDRAALSELVTRIQHPLYRLSLRFLGHPQDAQDAAQEILIRIITRLGTFEGRSEFMTWAYSVAIRMLLRTRKRAVESSVRGAEPFAELLDRNLAAQDFTAEEAEYRLLCEEVRISCTYGMLLCLSRPLRAAYLLGDVLGLTDVEGAVILEIAPAAFRQRVSRARRRVRQVIDNRCGLSTPPTRAGAAGRSKAASPWASSTGTIPPLPGTLENRVLRPSLTSWRQPQPNSMSSPRSAICTVSTASPPRKRCSRTSSAPVPTCSRGRTGRRVADFKDELSPSAVVALAGELHRAWAGFPVRQFADDAGRGLDPLALMQRVRHIAAALARTLPTSFVEAAAVLDNAADSPSFTGWMTLPCGFYVAEHGLDAPHVALPLLARLSPRFSTEGSIRPFVERHPDVTFEYLHMWARDPDEHVRRLVSEGTRPRLPWANQLRELIADPTPVLPLLDLLVDDPSDYVRRSVANHVNDIAKGHPAIALECARRWQAGGSDRAAWVVRHGLRTLVERGDPAALALLGFDTAAAITLDRLTVTPARLPIGEEAAIEFTVSTASEAARVIIDYVVHHAGVRGTRRPKVFKLTTRTIQPGQPQTIIRLHRFREVSVRRIYPGPHRIEIQVNGKVLGGAEIELVDG